MSKEPSYSVSQLSELAGVSVRTLHHYDKIGLLKPPVRNEKGYRFYGYRELVLLQQILIYRELDFSLEAIAKLLNADDYDLLDALKSQRLLLLDRQTNTQSMINSIEVTMTNLKAKQYNDVFFEGIPKDKAEDLHEKAKASIPNEVRIKYLNWLNTLSKDEIKEMKKRSDIFNTAYEAVMHFPVDAPEVQALAKEHYEQMQTQFAALKDDFAGIDYPMFIEMAEEVAKNPFFREFYESWKTGMADHLSDALAAYAEMNLKK